MAGDDRGAVANGRSAWAAGGNTAGMAVAREEGRGGRGGCLAFRRRSALCALALALLVLAPDRARAYLAAGDRVFPATIVLPQVAPSDEFYVRGGSFPRAGGGPGAATRRSDLALTYDKTITDRLGVAVTMTYTGLDIEGDGTRTGWQNVSTAIQYLALRDPPREFLLTVGVKRGWGGSGAGRVGASRFGATQSTVYFAKGLGDLPIGKLRPLALEGIVGYQLADSAPRPDRAVAGFALEYSVPYLASKVAVVNLPDVVRHLTPIAEFLMSAPAGSSYGSRTTALFAPGIVYSGEGWEFGIEALLPLTRATGRGIGVTAQFHIALDFLFPESLGRPFFSKY